ncbi:hypothetical protein [Aliikangiella sp. G2MR2-5]|uniref:hypothetical protein n=1 Tax=Aliikangiella sp. G2MR2-5 TaxID=2788943 RepID=UPI0018AA0A0E|nr:hypothetical protein [Aliikangiella sp. G2MR2-5]
MEVENVVADNRFYSELFFELSVLIGKNTEVQKMRFNSGSERIEPFMRNYKYRVSPWPCIIGEKFTKKINDLVRKVPSLVQKVLRLKLDEGVDEFASYLNVSPIVAALFNEQKFDISDVPIRFDAIIQERQIRLLELNCGAALGGWQMDSLSPEVLNSLHVFEQSGTWNIKHRNICESLFGSICQSIFRIKGKKVTGNILFYMPELTDERRSIIQQRFQSVYEYVRPSHLSSGDVIFIKNLSDLEFSSDGYALANSVVVDAIIFAVDKDGQVPVSKYNQVQAESAKGKFYYPDHSNFVLMGNKHVFSLMHENSIQKKLSKDELETIQQYFPWSRKLSKIEEQGSDEIDIQLLLEQKNRFLLKKAHSAQGEDVIIGSSVSDKEWSDSVEMLRNDNDWIVQSYCEPDLVLTADEFSGYQNFRMIWGIFSLSGKYAGSFLRGVPDMSDSTVINSAHGATEFLVFEEQEKKKKVLI